MLKIKDNVDLKELEKYGLNYTIGEDWHRCNDNMSISLGDNQEININCDDCYFDKDIYECFEWLYDLIKADLVEKVGEEYQWQYKNAYDYLQELKGSDKE